MRALIRYVKYGKKTVWVRRFKSEANLFANKMFPKKMIRTASGKTKHKIKIDDIKKVGRKVYYKGVAFFEVVALTEFNANRSADDPDVDTIIFDEFTTTPEKYSLYRGNECAHFMDLATSEKRINPIKIFFLGNKETFGNPYFSYFGIPLPEIDFTGIRTYNNNSILVQVVDDLPDEVKTSYDGKWTDAIKNTPYYKYLTQGAIKTGTYNNIKKVPTQAKLYGQIDFVGAVSILSLDGVLYCRRGITDINKTIYTYTPLRKYKNERIIKSDDRQMFNYIRHCFKFNKIWYADAGVSELMIKFYKIIGL